MLLSILHVNTSILGTVCFLLLHIKWLCTVGFFFNLVPQILLVCLLYLTTELAHEHFHRMKHIIQTAGCF